MDTIRLIKINDTQLYIEINSDKNDFSKKIEVNFKVDQIKSLSQKFPMIYLRIMLKMVF